MLQNVAHCQDFITLGALDLLLGLLRLPSIPYDFATTPAAEAFSSTIRVVTETLPRETLTVVMKQLRSDLVEIKPFWETLRPESEMLKMVSPTSKFKPLNMNPFCITCCWLYHQLKLCCSFACWFSR
jgi:E3 ubiquitin-protein ligase HUWE1